MPILAGKYVIHECSTIGAKSSLTVLADSNRWFIRMIKTDQLFSDHLQDQLSSSRLVVKVHVNDLLPCSQSQFAFDEWNGQ